MSVRVRFAPSPTGYIHIGNARAALLNYLFAKANNGVFILRLDDTDQARSLDEYTEALKQDLSWLGLKHDLYFKQSDRFNRYDEIKKQLISNGRLYPCYETPEELDYKRKRQLAKGQPPIYDRASLDLTKEQILSYEREGRKPHWRFKMNEGKIIWSDLVRGHVEFNARDLSDPVLIRADGILLYNLASVIDDLDYEISHIFRGEDHVTNTATQIQMFEAVSQKPCTITFAHTTLLAGEDGLPLSKRLGSLSLRKLRDSGIEPMAINSLLARLGTSLPIEPQLHLKDLALNFSFKVFSKASPRFSEIDLKILNHKLFHQMPFNQIQERLEKLGIQKITKEIWELLHDNIETLSELKEWEEILFSDLHQTKNNKEYAAIALKHLPPPPLNEDTWRIWTTAIKEETGKKGKELFMPLRQILTTKEHGPEMSRLILLMSYDLICTRLKSHTKI